MLLTFVHNVEAAWQGRSIDDRSHGIELAVWVLRTLMGPTVVDVQEIRRGMELGHEPDWLQLKWGLVIVSRGVDVLEAQSMGLKGEKLVSKASWVASFLESHE